MVYQPVATNFGRGKKRVGVVDTRLKELGIELPTVPSSVANYVGAVRTGDLIYLSGRLPMQEGKVAYQGKLGPDVSPEDGYQAARLAMLNVVATLKSEIGDLDRVRRVIKVVGMVSSDPEFAEQASVLNGASDLLVEIFGDRGRHARSAIGVAALPLNACVEIEMIVEVED
jgi:enamine deaminase RidA (YjgF/YER057c/UK114 family)